MAHHAALALARDAAAPDTAIDIRGMVQRFGSYVAVDGVDLSIPEGQFLSVLGPSGCGKSTLMRAVAGLVPPTSGEIDVLGQRVKEPSAGVGIVFQRAALLPWRNVVQNISLQLEMRKLPAARYETRLRELIKLSGLEGFEHCLPHELSGGMQQRVALCRALIHDPDILLMDEPFSALDALTRDEMSFELLRIWSERPKTVVFVTHSIQEAILLSDRIVVMSARPGRVAEIIDVPLPRPRSLATLSDPVFTALANDIRVKVFTRKPE